MTTKCQNYNRNYKIQDMEDMQQKRKHDLGLLEVSYATSCCRKALNERENTILSHYHYRVDPKLGKFVCAIRLIPCECTAYVYQPYKYWLPTIPT